MKPMFPCLMLCLFLFSFGGVRGMAQETRRAESAGSKTRALEPAVSKKLDQANPTKSARKQPATASPNSAKTPSLAVPAEKQRPARGSDRENAQGRGRSRPSDGDAAGRTRGNSRPNNGGGTATNGPSFGDPQRSRGLGAGQPRQQGDFRRPQVGISISPGGVQIFRGTPGPGYRRPNSSYYRNYDPWGRGSWMGYSGRGWAIGVQTQPRVFVPSQTVIVTQPPQGTLPQPPAPQTPERPPVPTADDVAGMPGAELRGFLLYAVDQLDDELGMIATGAGWQSHLRVEELRRLIPAPAAAPPAPGTAGSAADSLEPLLPESARRQLADTLERYDSAAKKPEYRIIANYWGVPVGSSRATGIAGATDPATEETIGSRCGTV